MLDFGESLNDVRLLPEPLASPLISKMSFFRFFLLEGLQLSSRGLIIKRPSGPLEMDSKAFGEGAWEPR